MKIENKEYRTIWFDEANQLVKIIDQTKLPHQFIIKDLSTVKDAINAIKTMEVRGAPLIGGTAAYGIVLAIKENKDPEFIQKSSEELIQSRPTAINLKWAVDRMMNKLSGINSDQILDIALNEAKRLNVPTKVYQISTTKEIREALLNTPVNDVWGVGRRLTEHLNKAKVTNALQLVELDPNYIKRKFIITN